MSSISTKKPLSLSLPRVLRGAATSEAMQQGQEWPCSVVAVDGAIVTVSFEVESDQTLPQVTCPIAESAYVRLPIQVGDKGYLSAASTRLGGVTGLGSGLAPTSLPMNLGGLVFVPLGNKAWETIDPNAVVINAPNGAVLRDIAGHSVVTIDTNQVKVVQAGVTVEITDGNVTITAPNNVTINVPTATINGDLQVAGDVSVTGMLDVSGEISSSTGIAAPILTVSGAASVGSLTIGGKPYAIHEHGPGMYKAGSTSITGDSGGPI